MRHGADTIESEYKQIKKEILEQNEVREACGIWNHLWSIDGLDMDGHDITRELKREYQDKDQVGIYRSPYY